MNKIKLLAPKQRKISIETAPDGELVLRAEFYEAEGLPVYVPIPLSALSQALAGVSVRDGRQGDAPPLALFYAGINYRDLYAVIADEKQEFHTTDERTKFRVVRINNSLPRTEAIKAGIVAASEMAPTVKKPLPAEYPRDWWVADLSFAIAIGVFFGKLLFRFTKYILNA